MQGRFFFLPYKFCLTEEVGVWGWAHSNFGILRYNLLMHLPKLRKKRYHPNLYYNSFHDSFTTGCQCFTCTASLLFSYPTRSPSPSQIPNTLGPLSKKESVPASFSKHVLHSIKQNFWEGRQTKPACHTVRSRAARKHVQLHHKCPNTPQGCSSRNPAVAAKGCSTSIKPGLSTTIPIAVPAEKQMPQGHTYQENSVCVSFRLYPKSRLSLGFVGIQALVYILAAKGFRICVVFVCLYPWKGEFVIQKNYKEKMWGRHK